MVETNAWKRPLAAFAAGCLIMLAATLSMGLLLAAVAASHILRLERQSRRPVPAGGARANRAEGIVRAPGEGAGR